jgi:diguanylate cyclase (GGDEF)-like protein
MWWRRGAPEVATARVIGPVIGLLYLLGGLAVLAVVVLPSGSGGQPVVLAVIGPVAMATGATLIRWGHRLKRALFHGLVVLGTALITCVVLAAPGVAAAMGLAGIYAFIAVAAFFLFAPWLALLHLGTGIAACTVALSLRGVPPGPVGALAVVSAAIAVIVATLVQRASSASLDGLTGLANRRGFDDALDEAMLGTARTGVQFSVALIDVDHFKAINDEHGHAAGDELLRSVAQECVPRLPRGALLARHGGDEFALLLPSCSGAAALRVVEELRIACSRVPLSAGVAQHAPWELASQLMRRADTALYRAKAGGRGRCALHDGDQDDGPAPSGTARRAVRD